MGSNKSNTTSSMGSAWKVVQNGTNSSSFGNDEDDSSGMAWVKKRRAERERAKLEAEKNEQEHGDAEIPQPTITEEEAQETPRLPKEDNIPHPPIDTPTVAPAEEPHERPEHVTTAVNLPPHRLHKRETSFSHRVQTPQVESPTQDKSSFGVGVFDMEPDEVPEVTPETPEPSTGSASEDDGDEELSSSDGGDEDESDSYSEVCVPLCSAQVSLDDLERFRRRRMRIARQPWALVLRKSADTRTHLSRRPPICRTPFCYPHQTRPL